jgi:type II secretory pathway pseudopilin PulG
MNASRGFSTLEIMIAMTVLLLAFSATMMLLPTVQNGSVDTQIAVEALNIAEKMLENQQALARKDFKLVTASSSQETVGNLTYQKVISAQSTDYFTKEITATVSWGGMYNRAQTITLKTVVSNFEEAVGGDTCDSILTGNWLVPPVVTTKTLGAQIMSDATNLYPITDIDAYRKRLYVSVNNTGTLPSVNRDPSNTLDDAAIGTVTWSSLSSAQASDNSYATASISTGQSSHYLKVRSFGFTIPQDATIIGIKVDVERKASSNTNTVRDNAVRIVRADGTLGGTNQAHSTSWGTSDSIDTYGSATDLWGESGWSPSAINNANFGVAISATANGGSGARTASVDDIKITVTYTRQFYSLNISAPTTPTFEKSIGSNKVSQGFTSLAIATSTTLGSFAYVTTASTTAQFEVIDIGQTPASVVSVYKVPNAPLVPNTLFYKDGYVYVGFPNNTSGTPAPEFFIIDVHTPGTIPLPLATYEVGAGINSIYVKDGYAFLATDDPLRELVVLDLNDLARPALRGTYNAPPSGATTFGLGRSVYTVGDTLYFGRYYITPDPELAILDTTTANPTLAGSKDIGTTLDTRSVYGTVVRSNLAFLFTGNKTGATSKLQIFNISNTTNILQVSSSDLVSLGEPRGFDCESNYLYAASVPTSGGNQDKGSISIITAP